jgi:hypothetical protein
MKLKTHLKAGTDSKCGCGGNANTNTNTSESNATGIEVNAPITL